MYEVKLNVAKGAIERTSSTGPKSDGSWCPVINLKALNKHVITRHFKMESIKTVKGLMMKGDWLLKLDLKDAYLAVPIHQAHLEFLKFQWQDQLWQFQALPFGLNSSPYVFTKLFETSCVDPSKVGNQVSPLSGRHANNGCQFLHLLCHGLDFLCIQLHSHRSSSLRWVAIELHSVP